jgi:hypothetical protein
VKDRCGLRIKHVYPLTLLCNVCGKKLLVNFWRLLKGHTKFVGSVHFKLHLQIRSTFSNVALRK